MTDAKVALVWCVPEGGHHWCEARPIVDGRENETSARVLIPEPGEWHRYAPLLDVPDLFRRFAELEFSEDVFVCEDNVRRFADQYGALGVGFLVTLPNGQARHGTDLATWYQERSLMHIAMKAWDALQAEDMPTLQRWFTCTTGEQFRMSIFSPDDHWPSIVSTRLEPSIQFFSDQLADELGHLGGMGTDPADHWFVRIIVASKRTGATGARRKLSQVRLVGMALLW